MSREKYKPRRKPEPIETLERCCYGCGNIATFKTVSNKLICLSNPQKCPINKNKNSNGLKEAHKDRPSFYDYHSLPEETKNRMKHNKGKTAENYDPSKRQKETYRKKYKEGKYVFPIVGFCSKPELRWRRNLIPYIDSAGKECLLESLYEWKVANELDKNGIYWTRPEPKILSNGKRYEPDFYLEKENVYLDPKGKWNRANNDKTKPYQGFAKQHEQLEKIKLFEEEFNTKCIVIFDDSKSSFTWPNIKKLIEKSVYNSSIVM